MTKASEDWNCAIDAALDVCEKLLSREEEAGKMARRSRDFSLKAILAEERALAIAAVMDEIKILRR